MGRTNVYEVVNSSLVVDAVYSVLVKFDTLAGNVSSNTTFGKQTIVCCENIVIRFIDLLNHCTFFFKTSKCMKPIFC